MDSTSSHPLLVVSRLPELISPEHQQRFEEEASGFRCRFPQNEDELNALAPETEVFIGHISPAFIANAPRLRWVQQLSSGTDWLRDNPEAARHPFVLSNISDSHHRALAEHVFAWILAFARQFPRAFRHQASASWDADAEENPALFELRDKALLLLGFGSIGSDVARIASAFEMDVMAMRRRAGDEPPPHVRQVFTRDDWHEGLGQADLVVNTLPATNETDRMVDAEAFSHMKPGSYFFNIGRGRTVDEEALIEALASGHLAGAGLDVFTEEPLPPDSPLWRMPNVIVTPHSGGGSPSMLDRAFGVAWDNLRRFQRGEPLRNEVDKTAGY